MCDVILRLRSVIDTLTREYCRERVLLVCHTVVVLCFRYLLERLSEEQILAIDRAEDVANCSITSYRLDPVAGRHGKRFEPCAELRRRAASGTPFRSALPAV